MLRLCYSIPMHNGLCIIYVQSIQNFFIWGNKIEEGKENINKRICINLTLVYFLPVLHCGGLFLLTKTSFRLQFRIIYRDDVACNIFMLILNILLYRKSYKIQRREIIEFCCRKSISENVNRCFLSTNYGIFAFCCRENPGHIDWRGNSIVDVCSRDKVRETKKIFSSLHSNNVYLNEGGLGRSSENAYQIKRYKFRKGSLRKFPREKIRPETV